MRRISCDFCTKDLIPGTDARYTLAIDGRPVCDPDEWHAPAAVADTTDADEPEPDTDHIREMDEMLLTDRTNGDTVDEADELPPAVAPFSRAFDLCGRCFRRIANDPLGRSTGRVLSFSAN